MAKRELERVIDRVSAGNLYGTWELEDVSRLMTDTYLFKVRDAQVAKVKAQRAVAQMMLASPELFKACQEAFFYITQNEKNEGIRADVLNKIREAMVKAKSA